MQKFSRAFHTALASVSTMCGDDEIMLLTFSSDARPIAIDDVDAEIIADTLREMITAEQSRAL